ncbi:hypothetical protein LB557_02025 [Mesorhizobium sp. BR115XR7A]|uniref:hypothetical protein n=1 Tax=Mesorhizobium sp. BR115XR7A TaxID=2876645 RepID=UPI001CCFC23F|nr:hypothetical protein [Mesorhizobium sp. BR115XR7A]MBZ9904785.1 hypothetical protein [Mesorhizobium sp. BR115XR7A]MBZ9933032.1 hypothetical protein [Mesorhizobium sp. BR1-1-5]
MSIFDATVISYAANVVTIVGFPVAITGLVIVFFQIRRDKLAGSASAVVGIHESVRSRVDHISSVLAVDDSTREAAFYDLFNDLELACAIVLDSPVVGRTGEFAHSLIRDMLRMIEDDAVLSERLQNAIHDPDTFKNIRDYLATRP